MLEQYYFISNATFKNSREANVQVKVFGFITIEEVNAVLLLTKLMHETVPREQQKEEVFIQSHKHSFQGRFFFFVSDAELFYTKAFVCLQTVFYFTNRLLSQTYDEFCVEQKKKVNNQCQG